MKDLAVVLSLAATILTAAPIDYTTSWIANDGGWGEAHIPHDMLDIFVSPDGTVATICTWDEGGTNVGIFRDGRLVSRPEGSGTGGWGRMSGKQVVMDDHYVYQLMTQHGRDGGNDHMNANGVRQYPPRDEGVEWKVVRRYDRETGQGAPFPGGFGYRGDMIVLCDEQARSLEGLAIHDGKLYVSLTALPGSGKPDEICVYETEGMTRVGGYPLDRPAGKLAADDHGGLWVLCTNEIARLDAATGRPTGVALKLPDGVVAPSFSIDLPRARMLVPNRGPDMNVLIYEDIYEAPRLAGTLGTKGGIFAVDSDHPMGAAGEGRFSGPYGAAADAAGNIYVANTTVSGGRGTSLEAYAPDGGRQWKLEGLIFTATADTDRARPDWLYSPEKIHDISGGVAGGRLDRIVGYTVNPFLFPEDERINGSFITSAFKRRFLGGNFLFVSDMYGYVLAGYRFDEEKHGYIGVPFLKINGAAGNFDTQEIRFWRDANGDGRPQDGETRTLRDPNIYSLSFFVDAEGNIWRGTRQQGVMCWRVKGLDAHGAPEYEDPVRYDLPEGITDAKRVWYDTERRELFIGGFSNERPDSRDTWWCMGSTIVRCEVLDGALRTKNVFYMPFIVDDGGGKDHDNAKAFCVEGDYVFVSRAREGIIAVYGRETGELVGTIQPGESVHGQSGWCDFNYAINAYRKPDGRYRVINEENAFAKILVYDVSLP